MDSERKNGAGMVVDAVFALGVLATTYLYVSLFRGALIDDTYIYLNYARSLLETGTWGFYPGHPNNTATSPLMVVLLTAAGLLTSGDMVEAVVVLCTVVFTLLFVTLLLISRRLFGQSYFAWLAFILVASNPLIMSTIGMESLLYVLLLAVVLALFLQGSSIWLGIALGLLALTRPDGVLMLLVVLVGVTLDVTRNGSVRIELQPNSLRRAVTIGAAFALTVLPYAVFALVEFQSVLPRTLGIKTKQGSWGPWRYQNGFELFMGKFPVAAALAFAVIPFGLASFLHRRLDLVLRAILLIAAFGVIHFAGYAYLRVPPYHWYYVPVLTACILAGALGVASVFRARSAAWIRLPLLMLPVLFAGGTAYLLQQDGYRPTEAPIHTNWAEPGTYREIGQWLNQNLSNEDRVRLTGEVGTLGFYARRQLLDVFSCRTDCGAPWQYHLDMRDNRNEKGTPADVVRRWNISTRWVPAGEVLLRKLPVRPALPHGAAP
jgi:hypothetical protein